MRTLGVKDINTFTIAFDFEDYSEARYANAVAQKFGTRHREFLVKPNAMELLPKLIWHYSEPFGDSSCLPSYYVAQKTKEFVTVALNGDGGDESFLGYERYFGVAFAHKYLRNPRFVKQTLKDIYVAWIQIFTAPLRKALYGDSFSSGEDTAKTDSFLKGLIASAPAQETVEKVAYADVNSYLPEDLLVKIDIATMAHALEGRSPFLDREVMEFAARLPLAMKLRGTTTKYIVRKAFRGMLPPAIAARKKMGFGVPVGRWFRGELKDFLVQTLEGGSLVTQGYFKKDAVSALIREHCSGASNHEFRLWTLLNLELWYHMFIDKKREVTVNV